MQIQTVKSSETPLPGLEGLFSEIISKIPQKRKRKRDRPRKYDNPTHRLYLKNRSALILGLQFKKRIQGGEKLTVRQQQNHIHAERAWNNLSKSKDGQFFLHYFLTRNTLLAELGRIESKGWLVHAAQIIASNGLKGEAARAEIRKIRFGEASPRSRWNKYSILHAKIWKAVCQYRNLFPYRTDEEILAELKKVIDLMPDNLKWAARERERRKAASAPPKA